MKIQRRREHRNIGLVQLLPYMKRFPASAWVSLLHRASGVLLLVLLPLIIWAFEASVSSEQSYQRLTSIFTSGYGVIPAWLAKTVMLVILWAFLHHLLAGLRFVVLDVNHHAVDKKRSARSARWILVTSLALTTALGVKLFGLF